MSRGSMKKVFSSLVKEAVENGDLRDLLVDTGREAERPHVLVNGQEYTLGLFDGRPMLVKPSDRSLLDPSTVGETMTEIVWKLKQ